jgi:hypothetical protein
MTRCALLFGSAVPCYSCASTLQTTVVPILREHTPKAEGADLIWLYLLTEVMCDD